MKKRTIMDRFGDESTGDFVVVRDLHNRWMVYGNIEHSYRNKAVALPIGSSSSDAPDVRVILSWIGVDRAYVRIIDDNRQVLSKFYEKEGLWYESG